MGWSVSSILRGIQVSSQKSACFNTYRSENFRQMSLLHWNNLHCYISDMQRLDLFV